MNYFEYLGIKIYLSDHEIGHWMFFHGNEFWKDIPDFEGIYQASTRGRIKSIDRLVFMGPVGTVLKKGMIRVYYVGKKSKYARLRLGNGDKITSFLAHRLIAKTFLKNPDNKPEVNHKSGIKTDNSVFNLEWATRKENIQHSYDEFIRMPKIGIDAPGAKLNEKQVIEIKEILKLKKHTHAEIGEMFGIKKSAVGCISIGTSWRHLNK